MKCARAHHALSLCTQPYPSCLFQELDKNQPARAAAAALAWALAVWTAYFCCRSVSTKKIAWPDVRLCSDADSMTGYTLKVGIIGSKEDQEARRGHAVPVYPRLTNAALCPVLAFCMIVYVFSDQIERAGAEAGSWGVGASENADSLDDDDIDAEAVAQTVPAAHGVTAPVVMSQTCPAGHALQTALLIAPVVLLM